MRFLIKRLSDHGNLFGAVGLNNLIDVDMSPVTTRLVDDLHLRILANEAAYIPTGRRQPIASPAGGAAHNLAVNEKVQAGMVLVIAAADPKRNILPRNLELRRSEGSPGTIPFQLAAG